MQIATYLFFDGRCAEAFRFYERVLGGKIDFMQTAGESPMADQTPPDQHDTIMHVHMTVGDQVLMGSDAPPPHFEKPQGFSVSIGIEDPDDLSRVISRHRPGEEVTVRVYRDGEPRDERVKLGARPVAAPTGG